MAVSEETESISSECSYAWVVMSPLGSFHKPIIFFYIPFLGTLQVELEPGFNTERLMGAPGIHAEKIKYDK